MAEAIDELCRRHASPDAVAGWDAEGRYPAEAMRALAEAGWAGLPVPEQHGGSGGSMMDLVVVLRALGRHSLALAQAYYSLWVLGAEAFSRLGDERQQAEWMPRIVAGEALVAFALTEPGAGSDAAALRTAARSSDGGFVVDGQKVFITGAAVADVIVTAVRTQPAGDNPRQGISLLLIDPRAEGVTVRPLSKLGLKALDLCEVFLEDVRVPERDVLGPLDEGWSALRPGLAGERLLLAAICVGATANVLELALEHAGARETFGRPLGHNQLILDKLVEMRLALEAGDLLACRAAVAVDDGRPADVDASLAKLHATREYVTATREGVQIFGGYGYTNEYPVARHYRDAKYLEIGGGASEIQKLIVGRSMGLGA
ncbi:MAG: acyl-CoA/acyl-ACP dehydrogenase [Actinobacteria bacterium]|nr:acyl-CoA/acyl-ACP dehydrogenase [Actinomycetota bacterium]